MLVDGTSKYGRSILRGVTHYANLQRRWVLFKDLNRVLSPHGDWPAFDGLIHGGVSPETVARCYRACPNVVACSFSSDPMLSPVVAIDSHAAGAIAAQHLIDCRFRNFAFYGANTGSVGQARLEGFRRTLAGHGFSAAECTVEAPSPDQRLSHSHRPPLIEWLRAQPKPLGVLAYDDVIAHDLAETCLEANIAVPEQVAIVGVNNDDLMCESAWPPLSSVDADHTQVGYEAAKILDRLLAGEQIIGPERRLLIPPLGVVKRQSTDLLSLEDEQLASAMRFIREHACNPCTVLDVLRAVPVNRRWLERQFVGRLGRTPHDEIRRVRIETAQRLLTQTDLTMPQIAARCGFEELKSFYFAFKHVTGTTPAACRRMQVPGIARSKRPAEMSQTD